MPLFKSAAQKDAEAEAQHQDQVRRGVLVTLVEVQHVHTIVDRHCDEGWILESIVYAGEGAPVMGVRYGRQTLVFRWPRTADA